MPFLCDKGWHKFNKLPGGKDGCTCTRCGFSVGTDSSSLMDRHDWNGCTCRECGKVRGAWANGVDWNKGWHDWNGCTCRRCGLTRPALEDGHRFVNGICAICGQRLDKDELISIVTRGPEEWTSSAEMIRFPKLALERAFDTLAPADADEVLVACYAASARRGPHVFGRYDCTDLGRYVRPSNIARLFLADVHGLYQFFPRVSDGQSVPTDQAVEIVRQAPDEEGWDDASRRALLLAWKVADGELVTTCDLGKHKWEYLGSEDENTGDHYFRTRSYRCRICGEKKYETESEQL